MCCCGSCYPRKCLGICMRLDVMGCDFGQVWDFKINIFTNFIGELNRQVYVKEKFGFLLRVLLSLFSLSCNNNEMKFLVAI